MNNSKKLNYYYVPFLRIKTLIFQLIVPQSDVFNPIFLLGISARIWLLKIGNDISGE